MPRSSIFSFETLDPRHARRVGAWLVVIVVLLLVELGLRTAGPRLLPRPNKWGHAKVQTLVDRYRAQAATREPLDVVIFGTSQGYTWIDQEQLNERGLRTINAAIPGANMSVGRLLGTRVLFNEQVPALVVVTVGPMSVAHWNEHLEQLIEHSPGGGAYLEDRRLSLWIQNNVALVKFGGHHLDAAFVSQMRALWRGSTRKSKPRREALDGDAVPTEGQTLRAMTPSAEQFQALTDFLREAEQRGAQTALINMPVCEAGKHRPEWPYAEYYRAMLQAAGDRPMLDLDREAHPGYFGDCVHPNPKGVAAFREPIAAFLTARLAAARAARGH